MKEISGKNMGESCQGSSSTEVGIDGEASRGIPLKKGPWTPAEDAILVDFVAKNGEGNWNAVHKVSRLRRCGKSCRLRWANHLRPDLKKGAFTPEEECLIIELHAKMGNKWARMAAELPGRTDNEIKNFWNTRIKRLQRTGMPIYPLDVCLKVLHESRDGQNINLLQTTEMLCPNIIQTDSLYMPEVEFGDLEFNRDLKFLSHLHPPPSSMTKHWTIPSQSYCFNFPRMHLPGHLQESQTSFPGLDCSLNNDLPSISQHANHIWEKHERPYNLSSPCATGLRGNNELMIGISPLSHAFLDGPSSSSSVPTNGAMKLELPSFQYSDTQYPWVATRSALPSFGSADTVIQSPLTEKTISNCVSPRSSGLLEAVVYESRTLKCTEKVRSQRNDDILVLQCDAEKSISRNSCATEREAHGDLNSPLANSPVSVISNCTLGGKFSSPYHSTGTLTGLQSDLEAGN